MIFTPGFPPWRIGGEEYYSSYQAKNLIDLGHKVNVIAENHSNEQTGIIRKFNDHLKIFLVRPPRTKRYLFKNIITTFRYLIAALKLRTKPDLIYGHDTIGPGLAAVIVGRVMRVPVIIIWHGAELIASKLSKTGTLIRKLICKYADYVIVSSELFKGLALKNVGEDLASKFHVISPAVDINEFSPEINGTSIREEYSILNSLLILSVGRLEWVKGFDLLIRAISLVLEHFPNAKFMIVGGGSQKEYLTNIAQTLNVRNNLILTGPVKRAKLPKFYSACDVFLVPTRGEGFGMVFLEAWSCGKPIITTPQAPVIASLIKKRGGGIISTNDPKNLGNALITLLSDKNLRLTMGEMGRKIAIDFSWRKMVEASLNLHSNFTH